MLPEALQNEERYDFVLVLPHEMDLPAMRRLLQQAIEKHFHVSATIESRPADVYVMTALEGKTPPAKTGDASLGGGSIGWSTRQFTVAAPPGGGPPTPEMIRGAVTSLKKVAAMSTIFAGNADMAEFRRALEDGLERPIIDETNLDGTYDLATKESANSTEEFLGHAAGSVGSRPDAQESKHRNAGDPAAAVKGARRRSTSSYPLLDAPVLDLDGVERAVVRDRPRCCERSPVCRAPCHMR